MSNRRTLSFGQKIKLFKDDGVEKDISVIIEIDEENMNATTLFVRQMFVTAREEFVKEYKDICRQLNREPDLDFVQGQIEEMRVDFADWLLKKL